MHNIKKKCLLNHAVNDIMRKIGSFREWASANDRKYQSIDFSFLISTGGLDVNFSDGEHELFIPKGEISVCKTGRKTDIQCFGLGFKSTQSLLAVLDYFSGLQTLLVGKFDYLTNLLVSLKSV